MFVKNKVIDKSKIELAIESRNHFTEEALKKEWEETYELSKEMGEAPLDEEFNFYEYYDLCFSVSLMYLSLDELEFIRDNNLYEFDKNNLLDYRCQMSINRRINDYQQTIIDLTNSMQRENIGSYFQRFPNLFKMSVQATKIITILGLNRENIELTPEGEKLKICLDNIKKLFIESRKQPTTSDSKKR